MTTRCWAVVMAILSLVVLGTAQATAQEAKAAEPTAESVDVNIPGVPPLFAGAGRVFVVAHGFPPGHFDPVPGGNESFCAGVKEEIAGARRARDAMCAAAIPAGIAAGAPGALAAASLCSGLTAALLGIEYRARERGCLP